ncbi:hypothetical protein SAMN05216188_107103 [Lentzea xinjiangensis]|uniref:Uncharacterized protein n=1 Tax=Lentzea xinjiangensis TaxID=402600 RepID=A0A1H9KT12_9PSEU|nr:hypothetical protein SAMN05216188_107103 [Lentzea xinjiangensis]
MTASGNHSAPPAPKPETWVLRPHAVELAFQLGGAQHVVHDVREAADRLRQCVEVVPLVVGQVRGGCQQLCAQVRPCDRRAQPVARVGDEPPLPREGVRQRTHRAAAHAQADQRRHEQARHLPQARHQLQPVDHGQAPVDHRHVVGPGECEMQSALTVECDVHDISLTAQGSREQLRQLAVVLDEK